MKQSLLAFMLIPALLSAQDTSNCLDQPGIQYDHDGDLNIGMSDVLQLLTWFGTSFDDDQDGIMDCEDDCIGEYDECGVCNGPGPQFLTIDTVLTVYDSVYVDAIDDWLVYELESDTVFSLVCEDPSSFPSCGDPAVLDGYTYATVQIGEQCWFAENLRTTVLASGQTIPEVTSSGEWDGMYYSRAYCAYDNSAAAGDTLGYLYNLPAATSSGICPTGWHLPANGEWNELVDFIATQGFGANEGTALKSSSGWFDDGNGSDNFGFKAIPAGIRNRYGVFSGYGNQARFWTSTPDGGNGIRRGLAGDLNVLGEASNHSLNGFSIRCVED